MEQVPFALIYKVAAIEEAATRRASLATSSVEASSDTREDRAPSSPASSVGPTSSSDGLTSVGSGVESAPVLYQRRASLRSKEAMIVTVDPEAITPELQEVAAPPVAESLRQWTAGCTRSIVKCSAGLVSSGLDLLMTAWPCSKSAPKDEAELGLADFAQEAEEQLAAMPAAVGARARLFRDALQHAVLSRNLTSEAAATMRPMPFYTACRALEAEALDRCDALRQRCAGDLAAALPAILPLARDIGDRLIILLRDHLQLVARHLQAGHAISRDLLPEVGSALHLDPRAFPLEVCSAGSGVCAVTVVALLRLRRIFSALSDLAGEIVAAARAADRAAEGRERRTSAAAGAVRRDICLLAGTCTNLLTEPFLQVTQQLMVRAVA